MTRMMPCHRGACRIAVIVLTAASLPSSHSASAPAGLCATLGCATHKLDGAACQRNFHCTAHKDCCADHASVCVNQTDPCLRHECKPSRASNNATETHAKGHSNNATET